MKKHYTDKSHSTVRTTALLACSAILLCLTASPAAAQSQTTPQPSNATLQQASPRQTRSFSLLDCLSFKGNFAYNYISQTFLKFAGLNKAPDQMTGPGFSAQAGCDLPYLKNHSGNARFTIFVRYSSSTVSGTGPWDLSGSTNQQLAANGIATVNAVGTVKSSLKSIGPGIAYNFVNSKSFGMSLSGDYVKVWRNSVLKNGQIAGVDQEGDPFVQAGVTDGEKREEWRPELRIGANWRIKALEFGPAGGLGANGPEFSFNFGFRPGKLFSKASKR